MAPAGGAELLVLSDRKAPELKELTHLPDGMRLLGTVQPGQELAGSSTQHTVHEQDVTFGQSPANLRETTVNAYRLTGALCSGWPKEDWVKVEVLLKF